MIRNRKDLLAALRGQCGYEGDETLEAVKAFLAEHAEDISLVDENDQPIDVDAVWSAKTILTAATPTVREKAAARQAVTGAASKTTGITSATEPTTKAQWTPEMHRRHGERKAYDKRVASGEAVFTDSDEAEVAGAWARQVLAGGKGYAQSAYDAEVCQKANISTTNTAGGATVPDDFAPILIDLKEKYGVIRQLVGVTPMRGDTLTLPRRTGGLTVYAPGEASTITESNPTVDNVSLVAVKMATYTEVSNELFHDSAISWSDLVFGEIAQAFANKEDECAINGDGTSTYFNVYGIMPKIKGLSGTIANIAGLVVGAGNAYSELTRANFESVISLLPQFADTPAAAWLVHRSFYFGTMAPLLTALGGVTLAEGQGGARKQQFLGYGVGFSQVAPKTEANSQVCALLGDFKQGMKFGEVTGTMTIASSEHVSFKSDVIGIRGIQRVAINVHDVGNASATAASRVAGPIVGLITAAA